MTITEMVEKCIEAQRGKGWGVRKFGEDMALIHSEVSEALEEYRNGHTTTETYYKVTEGELYAKPEGIPTELADIVIRIAALCGQEGIDLEKAIIEKMAYNATRPIRHGGKVI